VTGVLPFILLTTGTDGRIAIKIQTAPVDRRKEMQALFILVLGAVLLCPSSVFAQDAVEKRCEVAKQRTIARYLICRMSAEAKLSAQNDIDKYHLTVTRCGNRLVKKFESLERMAVRRGSSCPTNSDATSAISYLSCSVDIATGATSGGDYPSSCVASTCGDGIIDVGEQCDQGSLNSRTCESQGFEGGTLACSSGCVFDMSGCYASRFVNNGDGTITDYQTGLMWMVQDSSSSYITGGFSRKWDDSLNWANLINQAHVGFAGYHDWRLPSWDEFETIVNRVRWISTLQPAFYDVFDTNCVPGCTFDICSCTTAGTYWTSNENPVDTSRAWAFAPTNGTYGHTGPKTDQRHNRFVRTAF
jgi:hypothetical protein